MLKDMKLYEFLDELASPSPAPGGGSASALLCSVGAALVSMVCHLTIGKKGYEESEVELRKVLEESESLRKRAEGLIDEDTKAYNGVVAAYKIPKENQQRSAMIQTALKDACSTPLEVAKIGIRIMELSKIAAFKGNVNSISDAGVATLAAGGGVKGAVFNIKVNLKSMKDVKFGESIRVKAHEIEEMERTLSEEVKGIVSFKLAN